MTASTLNRQLSCSYAALGLVPRLDRHQAAPPVALRDDLGERRRGSAGRRRRGTPSRPRPPGSPAGDATGPRSRWRTPEWHAQLLPVQWSGSGGAVTTSTPGCASATSAVRSVEWSSTTTIRSGPGVGSATSHRPPRSSPIVASSSRAGMTTLTPLSPLRAPGRSARRDATVRGRPSASHPANQPSTQTTTETDTETLQQTTGAPSSALGRPTDAGPA